MEFQDVVRRRKMVRSFTDEPVAPGVVERMLANAVKAPSAGFSQGWSFLVLESAEDRALFWRVTTPPGGQPELASWRNGMAHTPLLIVTLCSPAAYVNRYAEPDKGNINGLGADEARWPVPYWHVDVAMAGLLILQTAVDEGLGACYFGIDADLLPGFYQAFGIPPQWIQTAVIAVGHPTAGGAAGSPTRRARIPLAEQVHRGRW